MREQKIMYKRSEALMNVVDETLKYSMGQYCHLICLGIH